MLPAIGNSTAAQLLRAFMHSDHQKDGQTKRFSDAELRRLEWASRRGMLELDLLLEDFAKTTLKELSGPEQKAYAKLMGEEDQDLYQWLMAYASPEDKELWHIISLIQEDLKAKGKQNH